MIADVKKTAEQKMKKTLEALKHDLAKIRTGRAHTGLLDHIVVDYYGTPTAIPQVANVTLLDARTIGVTPWDKKMIGVVERAIRDSDLGLNPATQGDIVRVPMPPLTEERRKDLIKVVRNMAEEGRVAVRNIRRHSKADMESMHGEISDDDIRRGEDELQKLTDRFVERIDQLLGHKEGELLEV